MTGGRDARFVLIHADESCLGNQKAGPRPGGAGAMIETRADDGSVDRWDWYRASNATTNNRMALSGAIELLERLFQKPRAIDVHFVSDSRYLVDGITQWVPNWKARGWKRKGGPIENLELWQRLERVTSGRPVRFHWVRGHAGHPKNEYVDHLAVHAARSQTSSEGLIPSSLMTWLADQGASVNGHDPDAHFHQLESRYTR